MGQLGWEESDVVVDGVRLHVYRRGRGRPVVLAHGAADNGLCWTRVAEQLETDFELIAYDARLHGLSEDGDGGAEDDALPYTIRGSDMIGVAEALGLTDVAAMGHSMGAGAASVAIGLRPDLFRCAVLEDPGWFDGDLPIPTDRRNPATAVRQSAADLASMSVEEIAEAGRRQNPSWADEEFAPWALSKKQHRRRPSPPRPPWREVVPKFACPVLVLCGEAGRGSIVTQEAEKEAPTLSPNVRLVRLPTGHNVRREAFDSFVSLTREFLTAN